MNTLINVAGWTLVHFVWQGSLIAVCAGAALWLLRRAAPSSRYTAGCIALATMLAAPIITARVLSAPPVASSRVSHYVAATRLAAPPAEHFDGTVSDQRNASARLTVDAFLPVVVTAWVVGVAFLLVRLAGGWWRVRARHRAALGMPPSRWRAAGERMTSRLGLRRSVVLVDSQTVDTPTLIGWLRPIILLPVAALTNLTPAQVDAILAHELTHVRRHDYLVNLLQSVAETLLFYHPAVWWVSSRIRAEREHCCDEVAVGVCGDAVSYASALAELETWRTAPTGLTLAATGGALLERVRRVLRAPSEEEWPSSNAILTAALILLILVASGSRHLSTLKASTPSPATQAQPSPRTDWQRRETPHFDVLYTQGLSVDLERIEREAERAYERVGADLAHDLSVRPMLVLFGTRQELERGLSTRDFPQTDDHILLSLDVPANRRSGELAHEITHSFVFDILPRPVTAALPLWIAEGLAEYQRGDWNENEQAALRDLVRTNAIPRMSRLTPSSFAETPRVNLGLGHAAFDFIVSRWSTDGPRQLLDSLRQSDPAASLDTAFRAAFGVGPGDFDRGFEQYLMVRFGAPSRVEARAAQLSTTTGPSFDVASVKPNKTGEQATIVRSFSDRFNATNIPLRQLIRLAFQLQDSQISGGPSWLYSDRFDVDAKAEGNPSPDQFVAMMRALLADRFKLKTHIEMRDLPIYALVISRADSKLGSQLQSSDCGPPGSSNANQPQPCGTVRADFGRVTGRGTPMSQVTTALSPLLNRVVVDRTALNGNFDFDLEWTPDQVPQGAARDSNGPPVNPSGPSIFTAIQEQLGLRLESTRQPIEALVIDRAEQPTEN